MEPYFDRIERYLNIHPEPIDRHNNQNRVILEGAARLGYRAKASGRNVRECNALGACGVGCPIGAKLSVDLTYIADATSLTLLGLEPVFVDVDPDTFGITPEAVRRHFRRGRRSGQPGNAVRAGGQAISFG